ncbi:transposase [Novipirellula sp.]|uniref:transposase n=1 Tax=Novipirellula sp. TaxID=2795430 RepID=UPI003568FB71
MIEHFRRRRLPHLDKPGAIYFVTACLEGSVPALGLQEIADYRQQLASRAIPQGMNAYEWERRKWKLEFAKSDDWLDRALATRHLENESQAHEVETSLLHFAGERYAIWAWVVMPNHFHWVFEPLRQWVDGLGEAADERTPRERIMHSVKRHSARQCNRLRSTMGTFWQDESYDHCVDDVDELERVIHYVERNPVKAGCVTDQHEYPFSSARYRRDNGIPFGRPLVGKTQLTAFG